MSATMEGNLKLFTKYFGEKVEVKHVDSTFSSNTFLQLNRSFFFVRFS